MDCKEDLAIRSVPTHHLSFFLSIRVTRHQPMKPLHASGLLNVVILAVVIYLVYLIVTNRGPSKEAFAPYPADASATPVAMTDPTCSPTGNWVSTSLLPKQDAAMESDWSAYQPSAVSGDSYLSGSAAIGVDTVNSSYRNPNLQLRQDPYIKKVEVSPFSQSTINCDPSPGLCIA